MANLEKIARGIAEQLEELGFYKGVRQASVDIAKAMEKKGYDRETIIALTGVNEDDLSEQKE